MARPWCAARYAWREMSASFANRADEETHLDSPHERGIRIEHDDVFRSQLFKHSVVFVVEVRSDDDHVLVRDEAKVLLKVEWVERFLDDLVGFDVAGRTRRVDAGSKGVSARGSTVKASTRTARQSS